jgi:hypothetical protein
VVKRAGIGADWLAVRRVLRDRSAGREETRFGFSRGDRSGPGGGASEAAPVGMTETPAGRLDVGAGPLAAGVLSVVGQSIQAWQTGSGRQEYGQQEESLGLDQSRGHKISIAGKTRTGTHRQSLRAAELHRAVIAREPFDYAQGRLRDRSNPAGPGRNLQDCFAALRLAMTARARSRWPSNRPFSRQQEPERRSLPEHRVGADGATVHLHELLAESESQSGALRPAAG